MMASGVCSICGSYRGRMKTCGLCGALVCGSCSYDPFWRDKDKTRYCLGGGKTCAIEARKRRKYQHSPEFQAPVVERMEY